MSQIRINYLVTLLCFFLGTACATETKDCDVPELMTGQKEYNALVCMGVESASNSNLDEASMYFEEALSLSLLETPNFVLLSRLGATLRATGRKKDAEFAFERARISLLVFSGIFKCVEADQGFSLELAGNDFSPQAVSDVVNRMCGDEFSYVFERRSFDRLIIESELISQYLKLESQSEP